MPPIETDALIIGAGPAGLFLVFELGLLDIRAHVVDSLPHAGGQCIELYADKPIYDIPALPVCTGRELTERLLQQIAPFSPGLHLGHEVGELRRRDDGRFDVATAAQRFVARAVFIAAGVGSFQPKKLPVAALAAVDATQLAYRPATRAQAAGRRVIVVGAGDAALDAAIALAQPGDEGPASVMLLHRREVFDASPERVAAMQALRDNGALRFVAGQVVGAEMAGLPADGADSQRLAAVDIACGDGRTVREPVDLLLVFLGLSPKLGPLADWGLALARRQLVVDPATFATGLDGVYAVGDAVAYPGKKKLILCGFHEATLAAFAAAERLYPARQVPLQYTTSSPKLQRALGVLPPLGAVSAVSADMAAPVTTPPAT